MSEKLNDLPGALGRLRAVKGDRGDGANGETRLRIADLQRLTGDLRGARRGYQDYLRDFAAGPRAPEAAQGIALTWGMPTPATTTRSPAARPRSRLDRQVSEERAGGAGAFTIAEAQFHRQRYDDAIRNYQAFISSAPGGDPAQRVALARAKVGDALFAQAKYTEAIAAWQLYLKEHPTHGEFARVHRAIVDAEHAIALAAASKALESSSKPRKTATRRARRSNDSSPPTRSIRARGDGAPARRDRGAARALRGRARGIREGGEQVRQYQRSVGSPIHVGRLYEERTFDFLKAIEAYGRVQGAYRDRALQRVAALQRKDLELAMRRTFRTDEEPSIELTTQNMEKLRIRVFKLDLETFFRAKLAQPAIESLDVEVIEPDARRGSRSSPMSHTNDPPARWRSPNVKESRAPTS